MKSNEIKVIEKFKRLVSEKTKIHDIKVFGSRARGDATEDSDLDVLVVVDDLNRDIEKYISDSAWEAGFPENIVVVPVAISLHDLNNTALRASVFIRNVYREGISL